MEDTVLVTTSFPHANAYEVKMGSYSRL